MKEFLQLMRRFVSPYKKIYRLGNRAQCAVRYIQCLFIHTAHSYSQYPFQDGGETQVYHFMEWGSGELEGCGGEQFLLLRHSDD